MAKFITKYAFRKIQPKVIVVSGKISDIAKSAISQVLASFLRVGKVSKAVPDIEDIKKRNVFIFEMKEKQELKNFEFWLKHSSLPILITTVLGDIPSETIVFASEKSEEINDLAKNLSLFSHLVLNFDDETSREMSDNLSVYSLNFGIDEGADLRATDYQYTTNGTIFKLNFEGNIMPVWLNKLFGKKNIYAALCALSIAKIFNFNLVEASQSLKEWQGIKGEGKLIEGIKQTSLLDDSCNASPYSMTEMLDILGKINGERRKIAVLGDILGVGKYTIEAHETIGEKIIRNVDLLFTLGQRAKFIAKTAREKGMPQDKIFEFNEASQLLPVLKNKIAPNDLILIDGSKQMQMEKITEQLQALQK